MTRHWRQRSACPSNVNDIPHCAKRGLPGASLMIQREQHSHETSTLSLAPPNSMRHQLPRNSVGDPKYLFQVIFWGAWGLVCPVSLIRNGRAIGFQGSFFIISKEGLHNNRLLSQMQCVNANPSQAGLAALGQLPPPLPVAQVWGHG